jgi:hypothetical protein
MMEKIAVNDFATTRMLKHFALSYPASQVLKPNLWASILAIHGVNLHNCIHD